MSLTVGAFVGGRVRSGDLGSLDLSFFNKRPLVRFEGRILPLVLCAGRLYVARGMGLGYDFAAGTMLLAPGMARLLTGAGLRCRFRIPFSKSESFRSSVGGRPGKAKACSAILRGMGCTTDGKFTFAVEYGCASGGVLSFGGTVSSLSGVSSGRGLMFSLREV